jgi:GTP-binding protein EngB required for normal cell division
MLPSYDTESIKAGKLEADDLIIAFMGQEGSGKSQIIDTLTGQPGIRSHQGLISTNKGIAASRVLNHEDFGRRLVLIETPGFDFDDKSEGAILQMMSDWLPKTVQLSGIIYLRPITEIRITGKPHRNFHKFGELCGGQWAQSVVLVTTRWDTIQNSDLGEKREKDLEKGYWKSMIDNGVALDRFLNTPDSAWNIVGKVLKGRMPDVSQGDERKRRAGTTLKWGRIFRGK